MVRPEKMEAGMPIIIQTGRWPEAAFVEGFLSVVTLAGIRDAIAYLATSRSAIHELDAAVAMVINSTEPAAKRPKRSRVRAA
jgi:hypothetical protein